MRRKTTLFKLLIIVFVPLVSLLIGLLLFSYYMSQRLINFYILEVVKSRLVIFPRLIMNVSKSMLKERINEIEKILGIKVNILLIRDTMGKTTVLYGDPKILSNLSANPDERKTTDLDKIHFEVIPLKAPPIGIKIMPFKKPLHLIVGYTVTKGPNEAKFMRMLMLQFSIPIGISVILGIFLSYIFYIRLNEGVRNIVKVTKEIINGNYDISVEPQEYTSELYELSKALNVLKTSLKEQQRFREKISSEISHDIRTPLTSLRMNLEAIMDGIVEPTKERMEKLLENTEKLSKMVEAIKELSEIKLNERKKVVFNLSKLVFGVCESMADSFKSKGLRLELNIEDDVIFYGDTDKMETAVRNVLDNSLKYTDKGKVKVELTKKNSYIILRISDTGRGIPKDDLPHITDRFYRVHRDVEGMGIGLSLVKEIVEFHGGKLRISSSVGHGTTVEMIFENTDL